MQEEIDALMIINESFGDESDRQRRMIEDLENRLKSATGSESEVESESESEVGSESYVESEELKKGRRVQPERKVKKTVIDLEAEDARVLFYFICIFIELFIDITELLLI